MAARENQGYLIAVIILVLLTLVLALLTFLGMSNAGQLAEDKADLQSKLTVAEKKGRAHEIEAQILRAYVGGLNENTAEVPTNLTTLRNITNDPALNDTQKTSIQVVANRVDEIQAAYNRDMQQFVARAEDENNEEQTWSSVVRHLVTVTARKHNDLNIQRNQNAQDKERLESEKQALQERLNENEKLLATVTENFNNEKKRNADKEQQLLADLTTAQNTIRENSRLSEEKLSKLRNENEGLEVKNGKLETDNRDLALRIAELTTENFDLHDGIISQVGRELVYINRGRSDGLRTNQTFAVYDSRVNNFVKGQEKAKIEVIRITGPHTADAKITEQDSVNPIIKNDKIVTPTWDPGYSVPIALAGVFDMDGDGNSDLLQFIRLIENNGGRVVAKHDANGRIQGKIDASTRYLVLGGSPKLNPTAESSAAINNAIRELERQAEDKSVQVIDMRLMLNKMGRHNRAKVDRFSPKIDKTFRDRPGSLDSQNEGSSTR